MNRSRPSRFDPVAARIEEAIRQHDLPSVAVAVAQRGEIVWEEGFGWADREARRPATPQTLYSLASISKPITATALMVLVERGEVDLDRPINDYLGDAGIRSKVFNPREATVRRVAQHTAGLPLHFHFFYGDEGHVRPPTEETIRRYAHLGTPPGEHYWYSNLGYGLLDHLIARVSGVPFDEFVHREVFLPLSMTRSSVDVLESLGAYAATRYGGDDVPYPPYITDHPGASQVWASAHDLALFGTFHIDGGPVLSDASRAAMIAHPARMNDAQSYGIGWGVSENERGYRTLVHDGGMGGVRTALWLVPQERLVIAVLINSSKDTPATIWTMRDWIASALLPTFGESGETQASGDEPLRLPDEHLGEWEGAVHTHEGDVPLHLWVRGAEDIRARLGDASTSPLNEVTMQDGYLMGRMSGTMPTADAMKRRHQILLNLFRVRGETLTGAVTAIRPAEQDGGAPERRMGNALTHPAELRRVKTPTAS